MKLTKEFLNGDYCISFAPEEIGTVINLLGRAINTWPDAPKGIMEIYDSLRAEPPRED